MANYRNSRSGLSGAFFLLAQLGSVVLWISYIGVWIHWQGFLGFLIGVFTVPGIVVFPILFYVVENRWPVGYSFLWLACLVLFAASGTSGGRIFKSGHWT